MNKRLSKAVGVGLCTLCAVAGVSADAHRPGCDEKPGLRDCVKVEDPEAKAPAPSVYRQKKPEHPIARPQPAPAAPKGR